MLKIGAATRLADIAKSSVVQTKYAALAEAARKVASPEIRNLGTLGGNICQYNRCWYFRAEHTMLLTAASGSTVRAGNIAVLSVGGG